MTRWSTVLVAVFALSPVTGFAQANVGVRPEGVPGGVGTPLYLDAGGSYAPSATGAADVVLEVGEVDGLFGWPGIYQHFEAGAWASGGREAAAFAHASTAFTTPPGTQYLYPPPPSGAMSLAGYRVECNPEETNHCDCRIPTNCTFHTSAGASVNRRYRIENVTANTLPPGESFVPLLVDYAHHRRVNTVRPLPSPQKVLSISSEVMVRYREGAATLEKREAICGEDSCASGATLTGTLELPVHVDYLDVVEMRLGVSIFVNHIPTCADVTIDGEQVCAVPPYEGSAQALVDPFAYVDPSWEYADWFDVEVSDDDGDTWYPAERTSFDLEAFGVGDGSSNPGPDGGVPDAGTPDGGLPDAGDPNAGNPSDGDGGGGCSASRVTRDGTQQPWMLGLLLALIVVVRPNRSGA